MSKHFINNTEVQEIWSTENDPLLDSADARAGIYQDASGQHYLMVEHWGGGRHVMRITSSESDRIVASDNYRLVFWTYQGEQIAAADHGDWERAEQLEAAMRLKWEAR
jgi:hypothetical protein